MSHSAPAADDHRRSAPGIGVATYERILRKSALTPELRRILEDETRRRDELVGAGDAAGGEDPA